MGKDKLGKFLAEVSNWRWDEFARAEYDPQYTSNQSIIFALIRACAMQKLDAIKISLNRIDGKLKTPVKIEMPKVFYLYPYAGLEPGNTSNTHATDEQAAHDDPEITEQAMQIIEGEIMPAVVPAGQDDSAPLPDLATMSLRETLNEMSDLPRELPEQLIRLALETEQWLKRNGPQPDEIPKVKSVVAAHLLVMAQSRNLNAITEVFDQIDGKLVETIQILGDDIYITSYSPIAPPEAVPNKDGILQTEATNSQDIWAEKLRKD